MEDNVVKLAGDFGISVKDVKVEDVAEVDEAITRPKTIVPFKLPQINDEDEDDDSDFEDETIFERICALSEMFPETVRKSVNSVCSRTWKGAKTLYTFSRAAIRIAATSGLILAAPVMIQSEISQLAEISRQQQRQMLLGPGASPGVVSPNLAQPKRLK